jgi:FG-GAP-like repeat/Putative Ig domain
MSRVRPGWMAMGLFAAAVTVVGGGCSSSGPPISVSLSPSSPQAVDQGQTAGITATVTNDRSLKGVSWTLTGPGSLSNSTGPSVTYTPPTTNLTSSEQATVKATSVADPMQSASVQITVSPDPQIPFQTLANGSVGTPYSQTIALTGGTAPFQWSVYDGPIGTGYEVAGAVPDGLKLDPTTGVISGTPTAAGTWYFEMTATDAAGVPADNGFLSVEIAPLGPPESAIPFLNQSLVPTAVSPGNPGFTLHVSGTGFMTGAAVYFNRLLLPTTFVDADHLTAVVPATSVANAGTAAVTVLNAGLAPVAPNVPSNVVYFQVAAPQATVTFAPAANSPLQIPEPSGIAISDFNEDGKPDLAITANVRVYILLGNGDGTFSLAAGSPISLPSPPYDDFASPYLGPIAVGDFNNSGHPGLAVGEIQNEAAVILIGNGEGAFVPSSAAIANAPGMPVSDLVAADFNADGGLDLAIIGQISGVSAVDLGYDKGAFTTAGDLFITGFPAAVALGDFNGDGKLDAIVAGGRTFSNTGSGLAVSLGNGDGTFTQAAGSPILLGSSLSAMVAGDFNGDGKLDVAVTDSAGNALIILLGNGNGTFGAPTTIPVGNTPYAIVAGDFNNDGKLDLAVANYGDNTVTLLLGNGNGTFTEAAGSPYAVGRGPYQLAAADFNGDGKLDLAVSNGTDQTLSILLQQ